MSDIVKGYRTFLNSKSSVTALNSSRVYFGNLPQRPTYPSVVLNMIDSESIRHLTTASSLARSTIQADCYGLTYTSAEQLSEKVRLVTEHYTGAMGTETVRNAIITGKRDLSENPADGSELFRKIRSLDVTLWHIEANPTT